MTDAEIAALRAEAETFAAEPTGKSTFTALEMARDLVRSLLSTLTAQAEALAEARRERDKARAVAAAAREALSDAGALLSDLATRDVDTALACVKLRADDHPCIARRAAAAHLPEALAWFLAAIERALTAGGKP